MNKAMRTASQFLRSFLTFSLLSVFPLIITITPVHGMEALFAALNGSDPDVTPEEAARQIPMHHTVSPSFTHITGMSSSISKDHLGRKLPSFCRLTLMCYPTADTYNKLARVTVPPMLTVSNVPLIPDWAETDTFEYDAASRTFSINFSDHLPGSVSNFNHNLGTACRNLFYNKVSAETGTMTRSAYQAMLDSKSRTYQDTLLLTQECVGALAEHLSGMAAAQDRNNLVRSLISAGAVPVAEDPASRTEISFLPRILPEARSQRISKNQALSILTFCYVSTLHTTRLLDLPDDNKATRLCLQLIEAVHDKPLKFAAAPSTSSCGGASAAAGDTGSEGSRSERSSISASDSPPGGRPQVAPPTHDRPAAAGIVIDPGLLTAAMAPAPVRRSAGNRQRAEQADKCSIL